ncbi:beta carbonic anhydrase 5, chloroplastic isoform X2 [Elaeis guineensis]|uniref:Carbonic anhydrase n=1 Tax=Elaeis guineensis var. tenera TaxID=51953 RepID=A0A6I9SGG9_ELAGV|nr:beta carbonic anhydrase 5, chloroplastic [Elaeis guineensis]
MAALLRASLPSGQLFISASSDSPADGPFAGLSGKPLGAFKIDGSPLKMARTRNARLTKLGSIERKPTFKTEASEEPYGLNRQLTEYEKQRLEGKDFGLDIFEELKFRFRKFKRETYMKNMVHYRNLSQRQTPKFMVIACADSRVCPSDVLGFRPGEAFTVRNVANLVPPFQHGASETSAALEFAVNSLEVPCILIIGHSRCGGIQALMRMKVGSDSRSFIKDWVSIGKGARLSTEAAAGSLSFDMQCRHCERESINGSLLNLLTYPWIEKRVREGTLSLHGGYYDFVNCTFEKWTLVYREGMEDGSKYDIKEHSLWS